MAIHNKYTLQNKIIWENHKYINIIANQRLESHYKVENSCSTM